VEGQLFPTLQELEGMALQQFPETSGIRTDEQYSQTIHPAVMRSQTPQSSQNSGGITESQTYPPKVQGRVPKAIEESMESANLSGMDFYGQQKTDLRQVYGTFIKKKHFCGRSIANYLIYFLPILPAALVAHVVMDRF
jgi:hypothetical protein